MTAGEDPPRVRVKRHTSNPVRMFERLTDPLTGGQIPHVRMFVMLTAGHNVTTILTERSREIVPDPSGEFSRECDL